MKLSFAISTQSTRFKASPFNENLEENLKKISELGYDGVELAVRDPNNLDMEKLKDLLDFYNLEVPAIGTGQAYGEEGLNFCDLKKKIRKKAVQRIKNQIELAEELNAKVIIGLIRGNLKEKVTKEKALEYVKENLEECCNYASKHNVELSLEPINRYEADMVNTVEEGLEMIEGMKSTGLLLDTFHMNIEEPSINESIVKASKHINHVHLADSNRWAPGSGHLDFRTIIDVFRLNGYEGYFSAEILPKPEGYMEKTIQHLKKVYQDSSK